jgi:hypothetical protein
MKDDDGDAAVYFGQVQLGTIDGVTLKFEPSARLPIRSRVRNQGRVAHKADSRWDSSKNPSCGLVDNSPLHETEVRESVTPIAGLKCYP